MVVLPFMLTKLIKAPIILGFILLLALVIRGYNIGNFPSLNPDEAALGYNAYSLLQTGKDEHGASWPLHFESFGDYKPGGYVYLTLPFIKFLGLNVLAVRLPNLILSVLTILVVYLIVNLYTQSTSLALLSAFILTISPWHIHFSRGAWESSVALFFLCLGVYWLSLYLLKSKNKYLFLSIFPLIFSLYVYHSARLVVPAIVFVLFVANFKKFTKNFKALFIAIILATILALPVTISFLHSGGSARFNGVGLTADRGPLSRSEELLNQHQSISLFSRTFHNQRVLYFLSWSQKYLSHYDFNFLFVSGDDVPRSKSPDMGQLYLFEAPFLILGIIYLLTPKKVSPAFRLLLIAWFFLAPVASSLTFQAPSALRSLPLVVPLTIFVSFGIYYLFQLLKDFRFPLILAFCLFYLYSFFYYLDAYFVHAPKRYPFAWNTGFSQVIPYLESQKSNYKQIYFTGKYDQPYILYLFYTQYPPQKIQSQIKLTPPDKFGFSTVLKIDNINFGKIDWPNIPSGSLVIAADEVNLPPLKTFDFPNGQPGFKIYIK